MTPRKLSEAEKYRLAVLADVDPRTIAKVLATGCATNRSTERARKVLEAEGLLPPASPESAS